MGVCCFIQLSASELGGKKWGLDNKRSRSFYESLAREVRLYSVGYSVTSVGSTAESHGKFLRLIRITLIVQSIKGVH